jgi:hypothetical protein
MPNGWPGSLEGWSPRIGADVSLDDVVDLAFDYRGDVTVVLGDGRQLTGYVYNRNRDVPEPYLQLVDPAGASHTFRYVELRRIEFTGKDSAAGKSYEAWLRRKAEATA